MPSVFDPTTFLETQHAGNLDTNYVLPNEDDYLIQFLDKMTVRTGTDKNNNVWASMTIQCELLDCDAMKRSLNMDRILVNADFFLDLAEGSTEDAPRLDMGTNKNMRLKQAYAAAGIMKNKQLSPAMLKFQTVTGKLVHETDRNDNDRQFAKIVRFASADKMRDAAQ